MQELNKTKMRNFAYKTLTKEMRINIGYLSKSEWMTVAELARTLNVTRNTVYKYIDVIKPRVMNISEKKKLYSCGDIATFFKGLKEEVA